LLSVQLPFTSTCYITYLGRGYELVKRISKLKNGIKVILMSAFEINHAEMARVLPNIKINSIVSKPVSLNNLTKTIDENLK
jgi:two-component SAPR family response regulator